MNAEEASKHDSAGDPVTESAETGDLGVEAGPPDASQLDTDAESLAVIDLDPDAESVEVIDLDVDAEDDAGAMAALLAETVALARPTEPEVEADVEGADEVGDEEHEVTPTPTSGEDSEATVVKRPEAAVSIDLDADDEEYDRERLIAEVAAISPADEGVAGEPASATEGSDPVDGEAADGRPSVTFPTRPGIAPPPTIGADAMAVLSAMNRQGVTLPDELVLDLGEATTAEDRDRLLAAALAHVEMQDAVYRLSTEPDRKAGRWKGVAAALLLIAAMTFAVRPPGWITPEPAATLTDADRLDGLRQTLVWQVQQIEVYQSREGRIPDSLTDLPIVLPNLRFVRSNDRVYQLVAYTRSGDTVLYDSAAPAAWFDRVSARQTSASAGS